MPTHLGIGVKQIITELKLTRHMVLKILDVQKNTKKKQ